VIVCLERRLRGGCDDAQTGKHSRVPLARGRRRMGRVCGGVFRSRRGGGDVVKKRFSSMHEVAEPQDSPTRPVRAVASCGKGLECRCLETRNCCSTDVKSEDDGGCRELL
jgi:hypothetical protein